MSQAQIQWDPTPDTSALNAAQPQQAQGITWDASPDTSALTANPSADRGDYLTKAEDMIDAGVKSLPDVVSGAAKGFLQPAAVIRKTTDYVGNKIGDAIGLPKLGSDAESGAATIESATTPTNTAEKVGVSLEALAEFALGDAELKGLTEAAKLKKVAGVASLLEKYPRLAKIAGQAALSGTQTLMHGGSGGEAAGSTVATGVLGGVLEGVSKLGEIADSKGTLESVLGLQKGGNAKADVTQYFKNALDAAEDEMESDHQQALENLKRIAPASPDNPLPAESDPEAFKQALRDRVAAADPDSAHEFDQDMVSRDARLKAFQNPIVKKIQSGNLDDVAKELISGKNTNANLLDLKTALGNPQEEHLIPVAVFQKLVRDAAYGDSNVIDPAKLMTMYDKMPTETRETLFNMLPKMDRVNFQNAFEKDFRTLSSMNRLIKAGVMTGGLGLAGYGLSGKADHPLLDEILAAAMIGGGGGFSGLRNVREAVNYVVDRPALWNKLRIAGKIAEGPAGTVAKGAVAPAVHFVFNPQTGELNAPGQNPTQQ